MQEVTGSTPVSPTATYGQKIAMIMNTVVETKNTIVITLPDGSTRDISPESSALDVAKSIGNRLYKDAVGAIYNGSPVDIYAPLGSNGSLKLVTFDSSQGKEIYWHSTSHLMAQAIKRLWPHAQIAIGPPIDTGFYYDIDLDVSLTPDDLERIEEEMRKIIKENLQVRSKVVDSKEAREIFTERKESYKLEILDDIGDEETKKIYIQGEFIDLCRGPHLPSTGRIKNIKLTSLAGAYWRGDERNKMLQRIYGISFPKEQLLKDHLDFLKEFKLRDHRKIGKELDLFSFQPEAPGFVFWHGKGMIIYNEILQYWREVHTREGYQELKTPIILNDDLWHKSGHWDNYKDNMYFTKIDETDYAIKPMNCPGGLLVYNNRMWSYKDFPLKLSELGVVHRHEKSGVLHGLLRVRQFTQDDAHVYCTRDNMKDEIKSIINLTLEIYNTFGFDDVFIELSTKPKKAIGSQEIWDVSESVLADALDSLNISYKLSKGEGAFYGPKIDFHIKDCLRRLWQCGTVQLDFSMPERLGATYIDKRGQKDTPVMVHRAILGSIERFIGILIEHYGGDFPLWLSPEQIVIIPVSEKHHKYAEKLSDIFTKDRIRTRLDIRNEKVGYKIRDNELHKVPYMLVIGDREVESESLSVRRRLKNDLEKTTIKDFQKNMTDEIRRRT